MPNVSFGSTCPLFSSGEVRVERICETRIQISDIVRLPDFLRFSEFSHLLFGSFSLRQNRYEKANAENLFSAYSFIMKFMTVYGSRAVAGGIASAVTPAKINNAVVAIDESHETESVIMRKNLLIALILTLATGLLTGTLVSIRV
jgi:hypothetical protein